MVILFCIILMEKLINRVLGVTKKEILWVCERYIMKTELQSGKEIYFQTKRLELTLYMSLAGKLDYLDGYENG